MKIDKSKFSAEELTQYEALIAKATVPEPESEEPSKPQKPKQPEPEGTQPPKANTPPPAGDAKPAETQKSANDALLGTLDSVQARMEQLEKSLEMKELIKTAQKYEIIGEKPEDLAKTLYTLKKSDEAGYASYIAMLDKALALVQKSGLFTEIGKASHDGTAGGSPIEKIQAIAAEIQKADPNLDHISAVNKAWEQHPELVQEYENEYNS